MCGRLGVRTRARCLHGSMAVCLNATSGRNVIGAKGIRTWNFGEGVLVTAEIWLSACKGG